MKDATILSHVVRGPDCWSWDGYHDKDGYGRVGNGWLAHRRVYMILVGPIPDGYEINHICHNRDCVRPDHLEPLTRDAHLALGFTRHVAPKSFCKHGHPFNEQNTYRKPDGCRGCRVCIRRRVREYRVRKQEKTGATA